MKRALSAVVAVAALGVVGPAPSHAAAEAVPVTFPAGVYPSSILSMDGAGRVLVLAASDGGATVVPNLALRVDRATGAVTRLPALLASSADGSAGITQDLAWLDFASGRSQPVPVRRDFTKFVLAADGRSYVAGGPTGSDLWVVAAVTGERALAPLRGFPQSMSADGRFVLVGTACSDPGEGSTCDFSRWDRATGAIDRVVSHVDANEQLLSGIADDGSIVAVRYPMRGEPLPTVLIRRGPGVADRVARLPVSYEFVTPLRVRPARGGRAVAYVGFGELSTVDVDRGWIWPVDQRSTGVPFDGFLDGMLTGDGRRFVSVRVQFDVVLTFLIQEEEAAGAPLNPVVPFVATPAVGLPGGTVVLNVTVVNPEAAGFVRVWPCDSPAPLASNVNFVAAQTVAVAVLVRASAGVCFGSNTHADIVVDEQGSLDGSSSYQAVVPFRLVDTRAGQEDVTGNVAAGSTVTVPVAGISPIGADATAVMLSLTLTNPAVAGFATVWPCGETRPTASNVNVAAGQTAAVAVLAKVGAGGAVCVASNTQADVIVDAQGWYAAVSDYRPITPVRVQDSRLSSAGSLAPSTPRDIGVAGVLGVPADAVAAVLSVTVTDPASAGFATVWPCGEPQPGSSNLNFAAGQTVANLVMTKLGPTGSVCVASNSRVDVVVDVEGTYGPGSSFVGLSRIRLVDSRARSRLG